MPRSPMVLPVIMTPQAALSLFTLNGTLDEIRVIPRAAQQLERYN